MKKQQVEIIAEKVGVAAVQVQNTLRLIEDGATIPFISRYRKEITGNLDEVQISLIKEQRHKFTELEKRKETVLKSIEEQGKLTGELKIQIEDTLVLSELEDIYLPYKPKRKTRAVIATEKGLEPLAKIIMKQAEPDISSKAASFISEKVKNTEEALQGARDIIAEWVNENQAARGRIRNLFSRDAILYSKAIKGKDEEGIKYRDYFTYEEPLKKCPSHRLLAIRRGEAEGFLRISVAPSEEEAVELLNKIFIKADNACADQLAIAITDSYKRLIHPSLETEFLNLSKEKADEDAIKVFAENLRQLLLAPPLGQKRVLAIDPGYRTGCKIVCLDNQGNLVHNETIFPHKPQEDVKPAAKKMISLINMYKIDAIAIGNGTAGRETEHFIKKLKPDRQVQVFVVNESGASVYSASAIAREEFPQFDVTVRGAVSIGRRLMDPLAELVKIDPKSIGVGQYQHDVDQNKLQAGLDHVVEVCVNSVGVSLNTASKHLLTYVSGLGPQLAQNIVDHIKKNGPFASRDELKKVHRMGEKAFEQCAGFLRIPDAKNPLDNSAVHPECYHVVEKMAKDFDCGIADLIKEETLRKKIDIARYVSGNIGLPTLKDIMSELAKQGRDPRRIIKVFEFAKDIYKMEDLKAGMILPGIVTNITNFGAFVDIGVKQDGLVHISNLKNEFVSNPADVVSLNQHVEVKVIDIDIARKRIQLSMKDVGNG
ncbi:MAG: RNA-binding transcriptional accessory protein [Bacteroidia bacterium]|nr:RNA-binding transcriptional accessory protein [Bacteroidia bacterium]